MHYLLGCNEGGTFGVDESGDKYIYSWSERFPLLIAQITKHDPDLIFLQELEAETVPEFSRALGANVTVLAASDSQSSVFLEEHKYDGVYAARSDKPRSDGIALIWKRDVFEVQPSSGDVEVLRFTDGQKLALIMPLREKSAGLCMSVVTTHLHWNPVPRPGQKTLQEIEAAELISHLDGTGASRFVILGGDLNCGAMNSAYQALVGAGFEDVDLRLPEPYQKRFSMHVPRAPVPKLTDARCWDQPEVVKDHPCLSDYFFVRGDSVALCNVVVLDTGMQGQEGFIPSSTNGLPNKNWSASDHFPIGYEITLESPSA